MSPSQQLDIEEAMRIRSFRADSTSTTTHVKSNTNVLGGAFLKAMLKRCQALTGTVYVETEPPRCIIISGWPQDRPKKSALAFPSHSIALNITVASHGTLKIIISTHGIRNSLPCPFAMTMLSWSVLEYEDKYKSINDYDHTRELLKWGTDYLLRTFNSSAYIINHIYSQVGGSRNGSVTPDDHNCWERPEDMDYGMEKGYHLTI
ncbi:endoglucanase 12 [Tanacetum coccineum]